MGGWVIGAVLAVAAVSTAEPWAKSIPAAERTRTKLLPVKVTGEFDNVPLREVLKDLAHQVAQQADRPVMWTYAAGVKAGDPVSYSCKNKPLVDVLADLFEKPGLAYVVLTDDDPPREGWVWVVRPDEAAAFKALDQARAAAKAGKSADAKLLLRSATTKYPDTKSAAKAKALLEELSK